MPWLEDALLEVRGRDAAVVDAVAKALAGGFELGAGHGVEGLLDGLVADGVDGALPAGAVCAGR